MNINSRTSKVNFTGFASGAIASFTGLRAAPIKVAAQIVPIQSGSGDPSPYNVRPISGNNSCTISVADGSMVVQDTNTIPFGQTVYIGSLDVTNGVLTIIAKYLSFNSAEYYGTYGADNAPLFYVDITGQGIKQMATSNVSGTLLSNMLKKISTGGAQGMKNYEIRTEATGQPTKFYFRMDDYTSKAGIDVFLANNPLQVVATLATPITVQLTPTQIEQLLGQNNIYADTGNVKVFYVTV